MTRDRLKQRIVALVPEKELRSYIQEHDHPFSDGELVKMAYDLATTCEQRGELLGLCADVLGEAERAFAQSILQDIDRIKAVFHKSGSSVYELHIKETPHSYEERYLCSSYKSALDMIKWFCSEYHVTLTECSDIGVCRRRIISVPQQYGEDYIAEVQLDCDLNETMYYAADISAGIHQDNCGDDCSECTVLSLCRPVEYPRLLSDGDIVRFRNGFEFGYGVILHCGTADTTEEYYTVDLSAQVFREKRFDELFDAHMHFMPYNVSRISIEELPGELKAICGMLLTYLREHGVIAADGIAPHQI